MIEPVLMGALGGAVGGALGASLGWAFERNRRLKSGAEPRAKKPQAAVAAIGAVLGIVGAQAAVKLTTPPLEERLARSAPIFATLRQYYPAQFATLASLMKDQSGSHSTLDIQTKAQPVISSIVARRKGQIDDVRAAQLGDVLISESRVLADKDPMACIDLQNGRPMKVALASILPKSLQQQDLATTDAVLKQIATKPATPLPPLPPEAVAGLARTALAALSSEDRAAIAPLVQSARQPTTPGEARAMCRFTLNMAAAAKQGAPGTLRRLLATS